MTATLAKEHPRTASRTAEQFERDLRALEVHYWEHHPFHRRMMAGALSPEQLRSWVANRWYYQKSLPQKDAAIIANCPDPDIRRQWIARIRYHDGECAGTGGRERWLCLADAVGLERREVLDERHVLPGVRFAVDGYVSFARERTWWEGVASSLTELFAPGAMAARTTAWHRHYPWIASGGTGYFEDRVGRATDEGACALRIVLAHCTDAGMQTAALSALAFKCDVLWAMLDAIDYAVTPRADTLVTSL